MIIIILKCDQNSPDIIEEFVVHLLFSGQKAQMYGKLHEVCLPLWSENQVFYLLTLISMSVFKIHYSTLVGLKLAKKISD
jgi:hypothetical protein